MQLKYSVVARANTDHPTALHSPSPPQHQHHLLAHCRHLLEDLAYDLFDWGSDTSKLTDRLAIEREFNVKYIQPVEAFLDSHKFVLGLRNTLDEVCIRLEAVPHHQHTWDLADNDPIPAESRGVLNIQAQLAFDFVAGEGEAGAAVAVVVAVVG